MARKLFAWKIWVLMLIIVMSQTACSAPKKTRYEGEFLILFNTVTKVIGYTKSKEDFTRYSQLIYDNLEEYHQLYDIYNDYEGINNIKTINDHAGIQPVKVDQRIIDMLLFSKKQYEMSDGQVNVAFGAVLKIWHQYRTEGIEDFENAKLPPMELLEAAKTHTDINKVIIDEEASTVFLEDPHMSLDVGAIAKGYAAERVAELAVENGYDSGLISVGGNVIAIGSKGEDNTPWNVGIQNPNKEDGKPTLMTLNLKDLSLVTSGNYERYYTVDGKNYHHIIDPNTLFPSEYFTAVTVICKDSGEADGLSTAVFNMSFEEGEKLINGLEGVEAVWVFHDGTIKFSSHFNDLIKE